MSSTGLLHVAWRIKHFCFECVSWQFHLMDARPWTRREWMMIDTHSLYRTHDFAGINLSPHQAVIFFGLTTLKTISHSKYRGCSRLCSSLSPFSVTSITLSYLLEMKGSDLQTRFKLWLHHRIGRWFFITICNIWFSFGVATHHWAEFPWNYLSQS